ncbi:LamG-like jellyroll fold domain-containing protein [Pseudarthrobacter polychromogenes]|uniref:Fibronectin type-III domain-containing protein n=1 Tax=Pseudarthrobacter polychromogenes TaxID=1676 RepID=A0ABQ1XAT0_9MICC|nr:LamG-like jellyroll fold domain-containing protein [Pseudarthrobacter polychromogenes]GGG83501.1 hypothetical protein GCM10011577_01150 [Pseudarthrobacter polychromogenes]
MGAHDATVINATTYGLAKIGYGLTGGVLQIGGDVSSPAGTLEAWVNTTHSGAISVAVGNSGSQLWLGKDNTGKAAFGRPGLAVSSTVPINDGLWHHLALTVSGTVYTLWVDGVSAATSTHTSAFAFSASTRIGHYGIAATYPWVGSIDEVRFSNNVRYTAAFTPSATAFEVDANTTALFHLENSGSDEVPDTTPPTVPTGLATAPGPGTLLVSWTTSTDSSGSPSYEVFRATSSPVPLTTPIGTTAAGQTQYLDSAVSSPNTYYYAVKAVDSTGNKSAASAEVSGVPNVGATVVFAPNNASLVYSPENWDVSSVRAKTINPGAYLRFAVAGSPAKVKLTFDMAGVSSPLPILKYRVDDGGWQRATLASEVILTLPTTNAWPEHTVELVVMSTSEFVPRWSPQNAHVSLTGVEATGETAASLKATSKASKVALVFGDSIVEGYKNLLNVTTPDGSDSSVGWAYQLGGLLGAEVGCVGFGGTGWTVSGQGGVPKLASSYTSLWSGQARPFTVVPDIIIISLGHNDGSTDVPAVTTEAATVINGLLAATPITTQIVVLRPFSGRQAAPLQAAVSAAGSARVRYVDTAGWWTAGDALDGVHPTGYSSTRTLAPKVAEAVRNVTDRREYINVGGVAVPTSPARI